MSINAITRAVEAVTEVTRAGNVRAIISDDSRDRYKTIFSPDGCDWTGFMNAGGPVIFEHGRQARGNLPVGNAIGLEHGKYQGRQSIIAEVKFWDDEFSRTIGEAYRSKKMRGWSVMALPRDSSPPTYAEKRARDEWGDAELVYRDWELLDISVCSTPGNANTITLDILRSLYRPSHVPGLSRGLTAAQVEELLAEYRAGLRAIQQDTVREITRQIQGAR